MRRPALGAVLITTAAALALAACSSGSSGNSGSSSSAPAGGGSASSSSSSAAGGKIDGKGTKVGIILPDTTSSPRWVTSDPDALKAQCTVDNLSCDIQNANGSAATMKTIAESMENNGIKVLMIVNLDSASGAQIEQEAASKGVTTVDYDRLTLGGGAALYVSFDNVKVGVSAGLDAGQVPAGAGPELGAVRRPQRLADGQQRDAVQAGLRQRAVEAVRLAEGRRPVGAGLGPRDRSDDLQLDAAGPQQHQGGHGRQRRPGQLGDQRPQAPGSQRQGGRDRPGRQRAGAAAHPRR